MSTADQREKALASMQHLGHTIEQADAHELDALCDAVGDATFLFKHCLYRDCIEVCESAILKHSRNHGVKSSRLDPLTLKGALSYHP